MTYISRLKHRFVIPRYHDYDRRYSARLPARWLCAADGTSVRTLASSFPSTSSKLSNWRPNCATKPSRSLMSTSQAVSRVCTSFPAIFSISPLSAPCLLSPQLGAFVISVCIACQSALKLATDATVLPSASMSSSTTRSSTSSWCAVWSSRSRTARASEVIAPWSSSSEKM